MKKLVNHGANIAHQEKTIFIVFIHDWHLKSLLTSLNRRIGPEMRLPKSTSYYIAAMTIMSALTAGTRQDSSYISFWNSKDMSRK
jgi:hypothetical protein